MVKGKKKKKDLDFQKVKLKVGRRLKRDNNETKAEFKTRKIILKEVKSHSDDPLTALTYHSEHISHQGKLSILRHFNSAITLDVVKSLNKPILNKLSKFIVDQSCDVRAATIKCLKTCYNQLRNNNLSTKEFILSIKPYMDCAYTHLDRGISSDCHKFVEYFVNVNDPHSFEPLMHIILRRREAGNLTDAEKTIASKLKHYFLRSKQKQSVEEQLKSDKLEPLIWTETNYFLDLEQDVHDLSYDKLFSQGEVFINPKPKAEDIITEFLDQIQD